MIDILMAVYNGETYLAEQIESIIQQTETDWRLIICDDCSSDNSYSVAMRYAENYPQKIICYKNNIPSGSAQANFMGMLKYADSDYIMFSDQDDVWLSEKIEITLRDMKRTEQEHPNIPILVHSDLIVVDHKLNTLHKSFIKYQGLNPEAVTLNRLLVQNNVTGCTVMINKCLADMICDVPVENVLMHDWWMALVASAFGVIKFINKPLIKYRQHDNNQLGAVDNKSIKGILNIITKRKATHKRINVTYHHAKNFFDVYQSLLDGNHRKSIIKYFTLCEKIKLVRVFSLIKGKYLKQNLISALGQLIFC